MLTIPISFLQNSSIVHSFLKYVDFTVEPTRKIRGLSEALCGPRPNARAARGFDHENGINRGGFPHSATTQPNPDPLRWPPPPPRRPPPPPPRPPRASPSAAPPPPPPPPRSSASPRCLLPTAPPSPSSPSTSATPSGSSTPPSASSRYSLSLSLYPLLVAVAANSSVLNLCCGGGGDWWGWGRV